MTPTSNSSNSNLVSDYPAWKGWTEFGLLTKYLSAYYRSELRRTSLDLDGPLRALEVGFGSGAFLRYGSTNKNWELSGIEINDSLIDIATQQGYNVMRAGDFNLQPDESFDLIVAFDVLEHIPQPELSEFVGLIKRKLKFGGVFLARFPNGDSPLGLRNQNGDLTHVTCLGTGKIMQLCSEHDLEIHYLGGEAQPIWGAGALIAVHRTLFTPLKAVINFIIKIVFFPRAKIDFLSPNLTAILRKKSATHDYRGLQ